MTACESTEPDRTRQTKVDLSACYRLIERFGMSDLVSTHISAKLPDSDSILINTYGLLFNEVRASNLVTVGANAQVLEPHGATINPAGLLIHSAIHGARPDAMCVLHTHSAAGAAVSCQADGLLPISQHALQFYERIGYHDYQGIALLAREQQGLIDDLGNNRAMILRNHGLLTVGRTIAEAFVLMFNLDRACAIQVRAQAGGARLVHPPEDICRLTAEQHENFGASPPGEIEWAALLRELDRVAPDYKD